MRAWDDVPRLVHTLRPAGEDPGARLGQVDLEPHRDEPGVPGPDETRMDLVGHDEVDRGTQAHRLVLGEGEDRLVLLAAVEPDDDRPFGDRVVLLEPGQVLGHAPFCPPSDPAVSRLAHTGTVALTTPCQSSGVPFDSAAGTAARGVSVSCPSHVSDG
jgi:hypothetical protein